MKNLAEQKEGEAGFAWRGRLRWAALSLTALLLLAVAAPAGAAEEEQETISMTQIAPCKELKPFNNIDELLYQFYVNLDSDCLFKMPVAELEKIWGIKIESEERRKEGKLNPYDFMLKPYKSEKDAFYIQAQPEWGGSKRKFRVIITREYYEKHATLFPNGNYPKLLPPPKTKPTSVIGEGFYADQPRPLVPKSSGLYLPLLAFSQYFWLNSDGTRKMELRGQYGIDEVDITEHVPPAYKQSYRQ